MLNSVYFDGIQLYEEEIGASHSYDGEGSVISARDLKGATTSFEYNGNDDLVKSVLSDGANYTGCAGEARKHVREEPAGDIIGIANLREK